MSRAKRDAAAVGIIAAAGILALGLGVWACNLALGLITAWQMLGVSL